MQPSLSPLRNSSGKDILQHGFVEGKEILSPQLLARLREMPLDDAAVISNAVQKDVTGDLARAVVEELQTSITLLDAVDAVFGTRLLEICMPLVLKTEPNTPPQIAHADDHRIRELFGIVHLVKGQRPTEGLPYRAEATYPTDVSVTCDACGREMLLPDSVARRREHLRLNWSWTCSRKDQCCRRAKRQRCADEGEIDDDEDMLAEFNQTVLATYRELLDCPAEVMRSMRCLGGSQAAGDGIIALPTMIHRGPGAGDQQRLVLFFSARPVFEDMAAPHGSSKDNLEGPSVADNDEHDYSEQVHAGWLLARLQSDEETARVQEMYRLLGYRLDEFD